jgi:quercetin dioxygenase-like cupin family protein
MPPLTVTVQAVDASAVSPIRGRERPMGGEARERSAGVEGGARERPTVGPETNFPALEQAVLELDPAASVRRWTNNDEEVLFVIDGTGTLRLAGVAHALEPESGACLAPGEEYELQNGGSRPLRLISVRIPNPAPTDPASPTDPTAPTDPGPSTDPAPPPDPPANRAVVRRLADQRSEAATTEREFRIVADPSTGLRSATHFVGYIPTARAPEHFHTYDEVIYVLDGEGVLRAEGTDWRLGPGSCIQLPARVPHRLENSGDAVMRVAAVFRPAGSPAAAYYPDGTPAHPGAPPLPTR